MTAAQPIGEIATPAPDLRLVVELPSWPRVFFGNLRDLIFPLWLPPLELSSAPAPYWADVFVKRGLPWRGFIKSGACHLIAYALLVAFTRLFALQPQVVAKPTFDHAQVIYYQPSEYLPPLDTRSEQAEQPSKADPEFSRQPIISVPREADNRSQTIVTPPNIKLKHDGALPNIVAWSDWDRMQKPRLEIPPVPLTPAAEITRIAPQMVNSVVAPPPDATALKRRSDLPTLQNEAVAPPPDTRASSTALVFAAPQPSVIAPPPSVAAASARSPSDLNIGHSAVITPAPRLPVAEQRASAWRAGGASPQSVAPPPSLSASATAGEPLGSRGRVIALNLHPAVTAPADLPSGNRRGTFAATPEGHAGASGSPGSAALGSGKENGSASARNRSGDLPSGLYVGTAAPKAAPVAGDAASKVSADSVNPSLLAGVWPPRVTSAPARMMQPESASKLSQAERVVFGDRRFYSLTLNMPNLNSAGGSWVIRFAELDHDSNRDNTNSPSEGLSEPTATRKVDPAYPVQLMRENVAGTVILYAVIHADGRVGNVRVLRGVDDRIDRFAREAVAQWRFQPAMKNGSPVEVEATFQIPFRPQRVGSNF